MRVYIVTEDRPDNSLGESCEVTILDVYDSLEKAKNRLQQATSEETESKYYKITISEKEVEFFTNVQGMCSYRLAIEEYEVK